MGKYRWTKEADLEDVFLRLTSNHDLSPADRHKGRKADARPKVIKWLTHNPAKALGISDKTGSLKTGKMADLVLWNGNPLSVYSRPEKVWIDGALMFDAKDPKRRPVSDFELGQPGEGDTK